MEHADSRAYYGRRAMAVEQCECPAGYSGSSCESCVLGFRRNENGLCVRETTEVEPPRIISESPRVIFVAVGEPFTLECTAVGNPMPRVRIQTPSRLPVAAIQDYVRIFSKYSKKKIKQKILLISHRSKIFN